MKAVRDQDEFGGARAGSLPALTVALVLAVALAGLGHATLSDLWWGATHSWTVTIGDTSFRLPAGWRGKALVEGEHTLVLRNATREILHSGDADQILLREAQSPFDPVDMAQRWERLETRFMVPGDRLEPTPKDTFLREHYRCSDIKRSRDGRLSLACFDKEGRWVVSLHGRRAGIRDLSTILQSATPAEAAAR